MARVKNPFIVSGKIEPEYFCDRKSESAKLIKSVVNGNNVVLISPRRMGKTGLIRFCFDAEEIVNEYYTFFVDILHTSSLREFTYALGREIFERLMPLGQRVVAMFVQTVKSLSGKFGFEPTTNMPTFNVELGDIEHPEYTLEEIFKYIERADKPCIVAIDEFQQIGKYPEKNVEALLRSHIQRAGNGKFIFAGSERHMMQNMFMSSARPFYLSSDIIELKAIPCDTYVSFVVEMFGKFGKSIKPDLVVKVYDMFEGHTYYMQKIFNESFASTMPDGECTLELLNDAIAEVIESNDTIFREILSNMPERQKDLLYAIALEGKAQGITSSQFVKRHNLASASSVQSSARILLGKEVITEVNKVYSVTDRLLAIWINCQFGKGAACAKIE